MYLNKKGKIKKQAFKMQYFYFLLWRDFNQNSQLLTFIKKILI